MNQAAQIRALQKQVQALERGMRNLVARAGASSTLGLQRRLEVVKLTQKLEVGGTATAKLQNYTSENLSLTVTNLLAYPIADGTIVVVFWYQPPKQVTGYWYALAPVRAPLKLVHKFCCDEEEEQAIACEITAYIDFDIGDQLDDCSCTATSGGGGGDLAAPPAGANPGDPPQELVFYGGGDVGGGDMAGGLA